MPTRSRPEASGCGPCSSSSVRRSPSVSGEHVVAGGAAVELVHMATLVHDDLLDGADLRRGRPTVWAEHGVPAAKAAGDYLFARAFAELAATGDAERGGGARRRGARARTRRGPPAAAGLPAGHDGRRVHPALLSEDGKALRGGLCPRRREPSARSLRPRTRRRLPDRRRHPRLHRRVRHDREGARRRPARRDSDSSADPRRARGRRRPARRSPARPSRARSSASPATGAIETSRGFALEFAARARAALDGEPDHASLEALTHLVVDRDG